MEEVPGLAAAKSTTMGKKRKETVHVDKHDQVQVDLTSDDPIENSQKGEAEAKDPKADDSSTSKIKKRKSTAWSNFTIIKVGGGKKAQCNHCKVKLSTGTNGTTTHLLRHAKSCLARKLADRTQKVFTKSTALEELEGLDPDEQGGSGDLTTYRYDKEKVRDIMARMVLVHEYPFRMVEHKLFNVLLRSLNPRFEKICRVTMKNDCMKVYSSEKTKIKQMLSGVNRVSLTSDLWTSNQTIGYMCLTGHYLDNNWKLQKRILNFCDLPPPHSGVAIADRIFQCLRDWGIETKVCAITLDNASANDVAARNLKENSALNGKLLLGGKIFHIRCSAHILNLMVQDGLTEIQKIILNIRESVKYFKLSPSRLHKFGEIVTQLKLPNTKGLVLDVATRWNSTYAMLNLLLFLKRSSQDIKSVIRTISGYQVQKIGGKLKSDFPTANLILPEIWKIKQLLNEGIDDDNCDYMKNMSKKMSEKFDKYWGDCNLLISIAVVLDPRYKMMFIEFCFPKVYTTAEADGHIELVRESLNQLFEEYVALHGSKNMPISNSNTVAGGEKNNLTKSRAEFDAWAQGKQTNEPMTSELDTYLEERRYTVETNEEFSVLNWWKASSVKYQILSKMAADILSIPVSTVASESCFSAGGRVLDQYRSSLKPRTVEALICGGDWLRSYYGIYRPEKVDDDSVEEVSLK